MANMIEFELSRPLSFDGMLRVLEERWDPTDFGPFAGKKVMFTQVAALPPLPGFQVLLALKKKKLLLYYVMNLRGVSVSVGNRTVLGSRDTPDPDAVLEEIADRLRSVFADFC